MGKKRVMNTVKEVRIIVPIAVNLTLAWPTQLPRYGKLIPPKRRVLLFIGLS